MLALETKEAEQRRQKAPLISVFFNQHFDTFSSGLGARITGKPAIFLILAFGILPLTSCKLEQRVLSGLRRCSFLLGLAMPGTRIEKHLGLNIQEKSKDNNKSFQNKVREAFKNYLADFVR